MERIFTAWQPRHITMHKSHKQIGLHNIIGMQRLCRALTPDFIPQRLCEALYLTEYHEVVYAGAGEFGKAALSAVELQRSCDEDGGNAALQQQTEQRMLSLLQVCQRSTMHLRSMS